MHVHANRKPPSAPLQVESSLDIHARHFVLVRPIAAGCVTPFGAMNTYLVPSLSGGAIDLAD